MTATTIIVIIVLALALAAIFYAWHMAGTLILKTAIVFVALLAVFITLALGGLL